MANARIGRKNKITRRWALRGTRPRAPHDQRTKWAFAPAPGPVAPRRLTVLDQAGRHMSGKLAVPANITLVPLPPRSPELNPTENVRQFLRDNHLSNRAFQGYDDIVAHCCDAWNTLMDPPWRIRSIALRDWAHGF